MLTALLAASLALASSPPRYDGLAGAVEVELPRLDAAVEVDGRLDEPAWSEAALLSGFSGYLPVDGVPAADSTEVRLWYSPAALHVGVRAFEAHGAVRATLADRDRIDGEDHVQLLLDTFGEGRRAYVIAVNALGVQADGVRTEGSTPLAPKPGLGNVDLGPDFVFESRGRVTEWGYEVELRIPFGQLRYPGGVERWGVNVLRQVQHSGHQDAWAPVQRSEASFLAQSGALTGLRGMRRGLNLDLNPVVTSSTAGRPTDGGWAYRTEPRVGGNLRWGITSDLALNATVRPDFSQVEADAGQIPGDARYALFFPERRPFFVDGSDQLAVPNQLVHTRRIVEPVAAARLTGTALGTEVAVLSAADDPSQSVDGETHPLFHVLRLRRGIGSGGRSTLGLALTDRTEGERFNRVASVDATLAWGEGWQAGLQAAGSATRAEAEGGTAWAPLWQGSLSRNVRRWGTHWQVTGTHPEFEASAGYVPRTDVVRALGIQRLSHFGAPGAAVENWRVRLITDGYWLYDDFLGARAPLETKLWLENTFALRGGWNVRLIPMSESFAFDPRDYAGYRVERPAAGGAGADTVAWEVPSRRFTGGLWWEASTPRFRHVSVSAQGFVGIDPDFAEASADRRVDLSAAVEWLPSERLRLLASYAHSEFVRRGDGSRAFVLDIPRLKMEYQLARPLFLRAVGEYRSSVRDALRDPHTGLPILMMAEDGVALPVERRESNDLRLDWLLAYEPSPGTVFFAGYGSSHAADERLSLRELDRTRDGFFVKLSYVFRR